MIGDCMLLSAGVLYARVDFGFAVNMPKVDVDTVYASYITTLAALKEGKDHAIRAITSMITGGELPMGSLPSHLRFVGQESTAVCWENSWHG
eukprot:409603-Hanusia_phi.AAC.3